MAADAPITTLDPDDPYLREAQTFPRLNDDRTGYGVEGWVAAGVGEGSVVVYAIHRFLHLGEA